MNKRNWTAEVVSIGDEMTSGARLDTNAQWLSRRLGELGIAVEFHSTVGDTLQHNIDVFRTAAHRADFVVCTGGLGPTRDDLTREALAAVVQRPLEMRQSALEHIANLFAKRSREMPERNETQAMFPVGSLEIFNPQGTAPGVDLTVEREGIAENEPSTGRIFALPGVPAEMKRMFDDTVVERILSVMGDDRGHIEHHVMKFFGTGESDMERRLGEMIARDRIPRVGITVSTATISLRITASAPTAEECQQQIETTRHEILKRVGELHFGDGENFEQYHAVVRDLSARNESLVTVELGRSAILADWFASLGQSAAYCGGFCFADLNELARVFGVPAQLALETLRIRTGASWLLMVDHYPSLETPDAGPLPAADICVRVIDPQSVASDSTHQIGGHPSIIYPRIGKTALACLRQSIAANANSAATA